MTAIDGRKAVLSIQAVLRQYKSEVRLSGLWQAIHHELAIGVRLPTGKLRLNAEDREREVQARVPEIFGDRCAWSVAGQRFI